MVGRGKNAMQQIGITQASSFHAPPTRVNGKNTDFGNQHVGGASPSTTYDKQLVTTQTQMSTTTTMESSTTQAKLHLESIAN
ncbi:unnamed protein product [Sphenostylis stenocarpa]|uniref:Uncharacterized protein n=1 Tax=Sphenostylis stenocarpa TaxID=92480 RepID=A0AA86VPT9_9FABA|nr:unnamed protein product [Sphenostylis stenocarpa]